MDEFTQRSWTSRHRLHMNAPLIHWCSKSTRFIALRFNRLNVSHYNTFVSLKLDLMPFSLRVSFQGDFVGWTIGMFVGIDPLSPYSRTLVLSPNVLKTKCESSPHINFRQPVRISPSPSSLPFRVDSHVSVVLAKQNNVIPRCFQKHTIQTLYNRQPTDFLG